MQVPLRGRFVSDRHPSVAGLLTTAHIRQEVGAVNRVGNTLRNRLSSAGMSNENVLVGPIPLGGNRHVYAKRTGGTATNPTVEIWIQGTPSRQVMDSQFMPGTVARRAFDAAEDAAEDLAVALARAG